MKLLVFLRSAIAAVVTLTDSNFIETTKIGTEHQDKIWFVKFYAPWCPHCKKVAPVWEELSDMLSKNSTLAIADVDATTETQLKKKFDVTGFPRMYLFDTDGSIYKYPGARNTQAFAAFAQGGYKQFDPIAVAGKQ